MEKDQGAYFESYLLSHSAEMGIQPEGRHATESHKVISTLGY